VVALRLLERGDFYGEAVEVGGEFDLAAEAASGVGGFFEFEHIFFGFIGWADAIDPFGFDVDVAGGARADAAAGTFDAVDAVFGGYFHQGAIGVFDNGFCSVGGDKGNSRHDDIGGSLWWG
jgi:hypothetical protein